jgi:hypothetical protein
MRVLPIIVVMSAMSSSASHSNSEGEEEWFLSPSPSPSKRRALVSLLCCVAAAMSVRLYLSFIHDIIC